MRDHGALALARLRTSLLNIIGGLLVAAGLLVSALAWFGLRAGQTWAYVALTVGGIAELPFWWLVLRPYFQADVAVTLLELPPFMWITTALLIPVVIFGFIGLR